MASNKSKNVAVEQTRENDISFAKLILVIFWIIAAILLFFVILFWKDPSQINPFGSPDNYGDVSIDEKLLSAADSGLSSSLINITLNRKNKTEASQTGPVAQVKVRNESERQQVYKKILDQKVQNTRKPLVAGSNEDFSMKPLPK